MTTRNERRRARRDYQARLQRASAKLKVRYDRFDRDKAAELAADPELVAHISCRGGGCSGCCWQYVPAQLSEAVRLVLVYPALIASVAPELKRQLDLAAECGSHEMELLNQATHEAFAERWFGKAACALLDQETGRCRVYHDRPNACREHHVLDVDPSFCAPDGGAADTPVGIWRPVAAQALATESILLTVEMTGGDVVLGPLPSMLLAALRLVREAGL